MGREKKGAGVKKYKESKGKDKETGDVEKGCGSVVVLLRKS